MELTLAAGEITALQTTLRTLLSPLDYPTADAWTRAVNHAVNSLLQMDKGGVLLPLDGHTKIYSSEFPEDMMTKYVDQYYHSNRADILRKQLGLRVWNRKSLWPLDHLKRTQYYAEMVVPMKHFDAAGMSTSLDVPGEEAVVYVSRERPDSIQEGARELRLLEILQPAFAAGVRTLRSAGRSARALGQLVEDLEARIAIFDEGGLLQHAGAAFIGAVERDPHGKQVWESARCLALEVAGIYRPGRARRVELRRGLSQGAVHTTAGRYRLRGTFTEEFSQQGRALVFVALEVAGSSPPSSDRIRQRFGLTCREAEVAVLLGTGRTNREIARLLGFSEHTARRHTERVLNKLDVPCRARIAPRLAQV